MINTNEKLWDDVLFTVKLYEKRGLIVPLQYALQDYCLAAGKSLAVADVKFNAKLKQCSFASFYKDNKHYMIDISCNMDSIIRAAIFSTDLLAIIPTDIGINLRQVGESMPPDTVYPERNDQCRGYLRSLVEFPLA